MFTPVILAIFGLSPVKKLFRFQSCNLKCILTVQHRWCGKGVNRNIDDMAGGKPKFSQIARGESTLNFVLWCHEGPKSKSLQITELESKQVFLQGVKRKSLILQGVNIY